MLLANYTAPIMFEKHYVAIPILPHTPAMNNLKLTAQMKVMLSVFMNDKFEVKC